MSALTRTQKIILLILAVLDVAVIAGLAAIVVNATRHPAQALPASATPEPTQTPAATWTPTPTLTPRPTLIARPTNTPVPTRTPVPTVVPTETPTPTPIPPIVVRLEGPTSTSCCPTAFRAGSGMPMSTTRAATSTTPRPHTPSRSSPQPMTRSAKSAGPR